MGGVEEAGAARTGTNEKVVSWLAVASRTIYGTSYWLDRAPARIPTFARHRGELAVDVAIVGGGLTGCVTAYVFGAAGVRTALFDADRIGRGASAASAGLVTLEPSPDFLALSSRFGLRAARQIWQSTRRAGLDFAALLRRLGIRCDLEASDLVRAIASPLDATHMRRELAARKDAGLEATWLTPARLAAETGIQGPGGLRSAGDASLDPYRATLGLAAAARTAGALLFERSTVKRVKAGRRTVQIKTEGGDVTAGHVIIATNYPALVRALQRHVTRLDSYCAVTAPLDAKRRRALGRARVLVRDTDTPPHVVRYTRDDRVMIVGADQPPVPPNALPRVLVQRTGQLMYELSRLYPDVSGIEADYGWSIPVVQTADGLPCAGSHRNFPRHLFALGAGHNGAAAAYLSARILLRHYQEQSEKADELFGFARLLD